MNVSTPSQKGKNQLGAISEESKSEYKGDFSEHKYGIDNIKF